MKIIVGLGNIGEKYVLTRHNAGFLALDQFVKELEDDGEKIKWKEENKFYAIIAKTKYNDKEMLLVKPTTLMNLSGKAVQKIVSFYKEPIENIIIIYDDIDLPLGTIRVRDKGSAGTHKGMKSIIEELGTENFSRIRIGIESRGQHAPESQEISNFVLSKFLESEYEEIFKGLKATTKALKEEIIT